MTALGDYKLLAGTAIFISLVGAAASVASAIIAYRVLARQARADMPAVEAAVRGNQPIYFVDVTMTNRAACGWGIERAAVRRPLGARIVSEFDLPKIEDGYGNSAPDFSELASMRLGKSAKTHLRVAPAGRASQGLIIGSGDRHSETLVVLLPRWALSRKLSIRLSLASSEADQRRTTIDIVRELPAATRTTID